MSFKFEQGPGNKKIFITIKNTGKLTTRGIRQGFYYLARDLRSSANSNILAKPRFGHEELFRGKFRRASLPGESFANRSGDARKTLGFFVKGSDQLEFGFLQNEKTDYVIDLEEQLDRPTLRIAAAQNNKNGQQHLEREVEKSIKAGFK